MARMNYEKQAKIEQGAKGQVFDKTKAFKPTGKDKQKRFYLNVPYSEKDDAKALGAKWDPEKKQWYTHGGLKKFEIWMTSPEQQPTKNFAAWMPSGESATLLDYLKEKNSKVFYLTREEASVLYINFPLEKGWVKKFGGVSIPMEIVEKLKKLVLPKKPRKKAAKKNESSRALHKEHAKNMNHMKSI